MPSRMMKTKTARKVRQARKGKSRKRREQNRGTTPAFSIHLESASGAKKQYGVCSLQTSLSEGHPDKRIRFRTLFWMLCWSRILVLVQLVKFFQQDLVVVAVEVTTQAEVDDACLVCSAIESIGYDSLEKEISVRSCRVFLDLDTQSLDIAWGVNSSQTKSQKVLEIKIWIM